MRRRRFLRALPVAAAAITGCVRGPADVDVGTPAPDQYVEDPFADCDFDDGAAADLEEADSVFLHARLLRRIRRDVPVVRSDADGFDELTLFQHLFALVEDASPDDRGEYVRTDAVPADGETARRTVAAKACLSQPTFVSHRDWILSVAVVREGLPEE